MNALDKALEESLRRQKAAASDGGETATVPAPSSNAVDAPAPLPQNPVAPRSASSSAPAALDPFSPEAAMFRAETEDDDGYDPYSDYMDQLARGGSYDDDLEEDPWR